jgi:hypothetical protein
MRQTLIEVQISILTNTKNESRYGFPSKKTMQAEMGLKLSDVPFRIS